MVGDHVDGETGLHERVVNISKIIIHEEYGRFRGAPLNDLALLVLTENVELKENIVETIALAQNEDFYEEGTSVTVIGWGTTENYTLANVLQELEYEVADQNACHKHWEKDSGHNLTEILAGQVCIIDPELHSSAYIGDSGGPLFVKSGENFTQIGLVSWGHPYNITYNMFTNTYHHLDWIEETIAFGERNKTVHDYIEITDVITKMKKAKGSDYGKGKVNCKIEEKRPGWVDVKSQVTVTLYEFTDDPIFIASMKHKKKWSKSGTHTYSANFGPENKLTNVSCMACVAVLEEEGVEIDNNFTVAYSGNCPDNDSFK